MGWMPRTTAGVEWSWPNPRKYSVCAEPDPSPLEEPRSLMNPRHLIEILHVVLVVCFFLTFLEFSFSHIQGFFILFYMLFSSKRLYLLWVLSLHCDSLTDFTAILLLLAPNAIPCLFVFVVVLVFLPYAIRFILFGSKMLIFLKYVRLFC